MKTKSLVEYLQVPSDERHVASIWINDDIRPLHLVDENGIVLHSSASR